VRALVRARLEAFSVSSQDDARFGGAWINDAQWWTRRTPEPRSPFGAALSLRMVWWLHLECEWRPPVRGEFVVALRCRFRAAAHAGRWSFGMNTKDAAAEPSTTGSAAGTGPNGGGGGGGGGARPADALSRAGGALVSLAPCEVDFDTAAPHAFAAGRFVYVHCGSITVHDLGATISVNVRDTDSARTKNGLVVDAFRFVPVGEARDVFGVDAAELARNRFA
jgi:hypothetical protein